MALHPQVKDRLDEIERIVIETQEPGVRIIDKTGPLDNPADRDHCIQYMVAVPLIFGRLTAEDYEDAVAADPRIDALRAQMQVRENADLHARTTMRPTSATSATPCRCSSATARRPRACRWTSRSATASAAPRRHAGAGEEVRVVSRCAFLCRSRRAHRSRRCSPTRPELDAMPVNELVATLVTN